ncbi:MAG: B12-binding domain-containing radical SAM protein [Desulfomonilaceae bacterium]
MNVLLINPKTPPTFWSFPEQVFFSGRRAVVPPLGLLTVAALLPAHWNARVVDLDARELEQADWDWADVVMLSGMIVQKHSMLSVIEEAKQRHKTVVVGGPYVSSVPEEVQAAGCDFLVRGEVERLMETVVIALENRQQGGVFEADSRPPLTESPLPRFDLVRMDDYLAMSIQTSRGCPFDCEFCDIVNLYGRKVRCKSPEQVIRELDYLYQLGWRREVFIADDNFIGNRSHAMAVLDLLIPWMKSHGEPFNFIAQASVNLGNDIELIDLLTEANISHIFVGVESPDEEILKAAHKYQNVKNPLIDSLNNMSRNGLSVMASFIIGFDGEKKGAGERICALVQQTNIPVVMLNTLHILPKTKLWTRLKNEGRLLENSTSGQSTGGVLNYIPDRPEEEILEEYVQAWNYLYEPARFLARTYRYYLSMRPTRAASGGVADTLAVSTGRGFKDTAGDIHRFARLSWRQGLVSSARRQYWRQIFGMMKHNPSRFVPYIVRCIMGEDMFRIRKALMKDSRAFQ